MLKIEVKVKLTFLTSELALYLLLGSLSVSDIFGRITPVLFLCGVLGHFIVRFV